MSQPLTPSLYPDFTQELVRPSYRRHRGDHWLEQTPEGARAAC